MCVCFISMGNRNPANNFQVPLISTGALIVFDEGIKTCLILSHSMQCDPVMLDFGWIVPWVNNE